MIDLDKIKQVAEVRLAHIPDGSLEPDRAIVKAVDAIVVELVDAVNKELSELRAHFDFELASIRSRARHDREGTEP